VSSKDNHSRKNSHSRPDWQQSLRIIIWYWRFYWRTLGWLGFYKLGRDVFQSLSSLLYSFFFAKTLDALILIAKNHLGPEAVFTFKTGRYILTYILIWVVDILFTFDGWLVDNLLTNERFRLVFRKSVIDTFVNLDYAKIEDADTQALYIKTWNQGAWPLHSLTENFSKGIIGLLTLLVYLVVTLHLGIEKRFILFLMVPSILRGLVSLQKNRAGFRVYDRVNRLQTTLWRIYDFFTKFNVVLESKLSRAEQYLARKYDSLQKKLFRLRLQSILPLSFLGLGLDLLLFFALLLVYWQLILTFLAGQISVGDLTFSIRLVSRLRYRFANSIWRIHEAINSLMYAQYFYNFVNLEPRVISGKKRLRLEGPPEIKLENVWFKYPKTEKWVLQGINLTIHPKEDLAIVGENGAGKTTLIKLILHLYEPQRGRILINGVDAREIRQKDLLRSIRVIPQDFARYHVLTVAENIGISDWRHLKDKKRLWQAAKLAEAKEFIEKLPKRLATPLSKELEGGVELSTGQWQKLALARLFFNPGQVLILDEPTASIDPVSEYRIFSNIYKQIKDKTVIVISHRYQTIRSASRIVVIKNGRIIEEGSHHQLLAQDGYYAEAWKMQRKDKLKVHSVA